MIVGRIFGARSINWSLDRRRIGTIVRSGRDSRRIGAIGWSMDRMHISTIIVCVGSSMVLATGSFGWQGNASNRVVFIGVLAQILIFVRRLWAFRDAYDYITLVYIFHHWQFFLHACGAVGRQLSHS